MQEKKKIIKLITKLIDAIIEEGSIKKVMSTGYVTSVHKKSDKKTLFKL